MLSVCCLSGGPAGRLAALLELLRPVADELVVAVDDRADLSRLGQVEALADVLVAFPYADPVERQLAWLHSLAGGDWIFRIDDDEVPSRALLDALTALDDRLTHYWVPRRWLWDDGFLAEDPWTPDWQLRLVRPGAARFPGRTHIPVQADGPHAYLDAPLYHLDLVSTDAASRAAKVQRYDRARPGLRLGGLGLNAALYLPELRRELEVDAVPREDMVNIERVRGAVARVGRPVGVRHAAREEIDAMWTEARLADDDYRARIELARPPSPVAGEVREIDVRVTNLCSTIWPGGANGLPEIRLSYRWRGIEHLDEQLRTALPHDVEPGETVLLPVAFRAPDEPGRHTLVVDVVRERHRWFGAEAAVEIDVLRRRQAVVLVGQPPGEEAFDRRVDDLLARLDATLQPLLVGPKEAWLRDRFGTETAPEPPTAADAVYVLPAGRRREQLRLRRQARKLGQRHLGVGALADVARTTVSLILGAGRLS